MSAVDAFVVTNGMFIVNCKYHWSNLLGSGTAVCSHCGTDHNLSTEEADVVVFSSNLSLDTIYHDRFFMFFLSLYRQIPGYYFN